MRILLLSFLLVLGTPRIAAACEDDNDNDDDHETERAESLVMELSERIADRLDDLEEHLAGFDDDDDDDSDEQDDDDDEREDDDDDHDES